MDPQFACIAKLVIDKSIYMEQMTSEDNILNVFLGSRQVVTMKNLDTFTHN